MSAWFRSFSAQSDLRGTGRLESHVVPMRNSRRASWALPSVRKGAMVAIIAKRRAAVVSMDPDRLAGYSLRAGFTTSAALAGVTETFIAQQIGHRSMTVLRRYIRSATAWQNNAAAAVGL